MSMIMHCDMCGRTIEMPKKNDTLRISIPGNELYDVDICDECKEKLVSKFDEGTNIHTLFKRLLLKGRVKY